MYLVKHHENYYKIVKSTRVKGRVKKSVVKYVGKLGPLEFNRLKLMLKNAKEEDVDPLIKESKNPDIKLVDSSNSPTRPTPKVKLRKIRPNVYKKILDKQWLKKAYIDDHMTIGAMAQTLGVSKDRVREHLEDMGYLAKTRLNLARGRHRRSHIEFGWHIVDGQKLKDHVEFKVIENMIKWRNDEGLSYDKIAARLTEMGIKGRLGASKWDRGVVRRMIIRNSNYTCIGD